MIDDTCVAACGHCHSQLPLRDDGRLPLHMRHKITIEPIAVNGINAMDIKIVRTRCIGSLVRPAVTIVAAMLVSETG